MSIEIRDNVSLRSILKDLGKSEIMFVCYFVHLDLDVEIFIEKEGETEKGSIDFEIGD